MVAGAEEIDSDQERLACEDRNARVRLLGRIGSEGANAGISIGSWDYGLEKITFPSPPIEF